MKKLRFLMFICLLLLLAPLLYAQEITGKTALKHYIESEDSSFKWKIQSRVQVNQNDIYNLKLTSQIWQGTQWTHQLIVIAPQGVSFDKVLLMIASGSNSDGEPDFIDFQKDDFFGELLTIAQDNEIGVAWLRQTPNQPLFNGLSEDALLSFTLHNFLQSRDYSWPLLFPMVKSAVRAMDATEELLKEINNFEITDFIVSGLSKRGWTTWLTGASDQRVMAIAPMVIDILNMPKSLNYQIEAYQEFSPLIEDYRALGLLNQERIASGIGAEIIEMVDPFSYKEQLTMPKFIFMGTNDPYWVADNIKNYYDELQGKSMIHYVPNTGHGLHKGGEAMNSLNGFVESLLKKREMPVCRWESKVEGGRLKIEAECMGEDILRAEVWSADSKKHDFRSAEWSAKEIEINNRNRVSYELELPSSGYRACYVNFVQGFGDNKEFSTTTRIFIVDTNTLK